MKVRAWPSDGKGVLALPQHAQWPVGTRRAAPREMNRPSGNAEQVPHAPRIRPSGGLRRCQSSPELRLWLRFAPCLPSRCTARLIAV